MAHDLQLTVGKWSLELDGSALFGSFDPSSLKVDGAVKNGRLDPKGLKEKDLRTIEDTIRGEILAARSNPRITLQAHLSGDPKNPVFKGSLAIRGKAIDFEVQGRETAGRLEIDTEIVPSRWGIPPYEALMGAIKLQDRVRVRVRVEQWLDVAAAAKGGDDGHSHDHGHGGGHSHSH